MSGAVAPNIVTHFVTGERKEYLNLTSAGIIGAVEPLHASVATVNCQTSRRPKIAEPVSPRHHPVGVNACCPLPNFDSELPPLRSAYS